MSRGEQDFAKSLSINKLNKVSKSILSLKRLVKSKKMTTFTPSKINNNNLKDKSNEDRQRFRAFR